MIKLDDEVMREQGENALRIMNDAVEQRDCYVRALVRSHPDVDPARIKSLFVGKIVRANEWFGSSVDYAEQAYAQGEVFGAEGFAKMYRDKTEYAYESVGKML